MKNQRKSLNTITGFYKCQDFIQKKSCPDQSQSRNMGLQGYQDYAL